MRKSLVVTLIGEDRPGLVESVAVVVADVGASWQASSMSRLAGRFAGILLVSAPSEKVDELVESLRNLGSAGLDVAVAFGNEEGEEPAEERVTLQVVGSDRPGIIRQVSASLAQRGVNIAELETRCESAAMAGHPLFRMRAVVSLPEGVTQTDIETDLDLVAEDLMIDFTREPKSD